MYRPSKKTSIIASIVFAAAVAATPYIRAKFFARDTKAVDVQLASDGSEISHAVSALPAIPDTNYTPPAGAIFVAPNGNDANAGTQSSPLATLGKAVAKVSGGGTIVLRGGVYREGASNSKLSGISKKITVQAFPHEKVWLDGTIAQNTGWSADGSLWRLNNSPSQNLCSSGCHIELDPKYPMAGSPQMVFRDGIALTEVGSKSQVTEGKFYYDVSTKALFVGDNPASHNMEITVQKRALSFGSGSSGSALKGIGVRRYGSIEQTSRVDNGYYFSMVQVANGSNNVLIENNVFYQSASRGLFVGDTSGAVIRRNNFELNGMNGFDANNSSSLLFENNTVRGNNNEHFSIAATETSVVGGSKMCRISNGIIRDNIFEDNYSNGYWCDLNCTNMTIVRNIIRNNGKAGIHYEVSGDAIIASNLIYGNTGNGLQVKGSDVQIYNNTFSKNLQNLAIWEDSRIGGNNDTRSNTVKNNIFSNTNGTANNRLGQPAKLFDVYGFNNADSTTPDQMVSSMDNNAYYRTSSGSPTYVLGWMGKTVNVKFRIFDSSLMNSTKRELNGIGVDGGSNPFFIDAAGGNYQLKSNSVAVGAGALLPSDIASAIGVAPSPVNIGAIRWMGSAPAPAPTPSPNPPPSSAVPPAITPTPSSSSNTETSNKSNPSSNISITNGSPLTLTSPIPLSEAKKIEVLVDGRIVGSSSNGKVPAIDTSTLINGSHNATVCAYKYDGQKICSNTTVTVNNKLNPVEKFRNWLFKPWAGRSGRMLNIALTGVTTSIPALGFAVYKHQYLLELARRLFKNVSSLYSGPMNRA